MISLLCLDGGPLLPRTSIHSPNSQHYFIQIQKEQQQIDAGNNVYKHNTENNNSNKTVKDNNCVNYDNTICPTDFK